MDTPSKKFLIGLAAAFAVVSGGVAYDHVSKRNKTPEQACAELQKFYSDTTAGINKKNQKSPDPTDLQMEMVITDLETGAVVCHAKASTDYKKPAM